MSKVDQFESVFRAALRDGFEYEALALESVLIVTDFQKGETDEFTKRVQAFVETAAGHPIGKWEAMARDDFATTSDLLAKVEAASPDLIVSYRNLKSEAWKYPHSLGEFLDVLLQLTEAPVLVVPHPEAGYAAAHALEKTDRVLAMTDHLAQDSRLVSAAASFTHRGGTLILSHVEDEAVFERYIEAISKIPQIDTDEARELIRNQLEKEPRDYIESCQNGLAEAGLEIEVQAQISFGRKLSEYKELLKTSRVDLLVMHTKDQDQLAMHGQSYPLAVEIREIPILMI